MSSSQNSSSNPSRRSIPSKSDSLGGRKGVPPSKRDQSPRRPRRRSPQANQPAPTPKSPSAGPAPSEVAVLRQSLADRNPVASETNVSTPTRRGRFVNNWMLWAFLMMAALGGIGGASAVSLLRIPNLPNCRAIFWPLASAATRLQCADAYAEQGSVKSLLAAISLVEALPQDHPLRTEINERVELWAEEILHIADQTFNQGELDRAIEIAEQIPGNTAAADKVSDRTRRWRDIWEQAESIYRKAEEHLRASNFSKAFSAAIQLRSVDNEYWAATRYEELVDLISRTREEVNIIANAERTARRGTVDDILEALKEVAGISRESYVYEEAQTVLKSMSRDLLDFAEEALARQDSGEALRILGKIPSEAELEDEVADFRTVVDAYELTWAGTTSGYEAAIVRLQSIGRDRPLYARAQELKDQWRWELEGLAQLNWAKQVARSGSVADLQAAIQEAEKISTGNPVRPEGESQINQWRREIARIQDQPYIDRAKLTAISGDRASLQAAIEEAKNVGSNSVLYDEAQDLIADWRWRVQRMDNEPILAQARQFADTGQLPQAIEVASRIPPDQALYDEAQTAIAGWRSKRQARESYQQALAIAESGTTADLASAISLVGEVSETSPDWTLAQRAANQWSWELLQAAEMAAIRDLSEAIDIASQIPPRTEAYAEAQLRIRTWQADLKQDTISSGPLE